MFWRRDIKQKSIIGAIIVALAWSTAGAVAAPKRGAKGPASVTPAVPSATAKDKRPVGPLTYAEGACTPQEKWVFTAKIPSAIRTRFEDFLAGKATKIQAIAESSGVREAAKTEETLALALYWKFRSLYDVSMFHFANDGFSRIVAQPTTKENIGIQVAALGCLNRIFFKFTTLYPAPIVREKLKDFIAKYQRKSWSDSQRSIVLEAAAIVAQTQIAERASTNEIQSVLAHLKDGGPYLHLSQGLTAAMDGRFDEAVAPLDKFVAEKKLPFDLERYRDPARLTLARALYHRHEYVKAGDVLNQVNKDSNHMARVLPELAWVDLMANKIEESIGVGMNLQSGGFRNTFTPEGAIILAMAFNELCQYPSSLRALKYFHRSYKPAYVWLKKWLDRKKSGANQNLHALLLEHIEKGKSSTPTAVASEWLQSSVFLSHQQEVNLLHDEKAGMEKVFKMHAEEMDQIQAEIKQMTADLNDKIKDAKAIKAAKKIIPQSTLQEMQLMTSNLKKKKVRLEMTRMAGRMLGKMQFWYDTNSGKTETRLIARMNAEFQYRNLVMLKRLGEMAEKAYLIQIDIYNGASQDIVWIDAHPEYKEYVTKLKKEAESARSSEVYNWGNAPTLADGSSEIWEDELGSLKAPMTDNCSNKDRYLALLMDKNPE